MTKFPSFLVLTLSTAFAFSAGYYKGSQDSSNAKISEVAIVQPNINGEEFSTINTGATFEGQDSNEADSSALRENGAGIESINADIATKDELTNKTANSEFGDDHRSEALEKNIASTLNSIRSLELNEEFTESDEKYFELEYELIKTISENPELIPDFISRYLAEKDEQSRLALQTALLNAHSREVSSQVLNKLATSFGAERAQLLSILQEAGVHSGEEANQVIALTNTLQDPAELEYAIKAFREFDAPPATRTTIRQTLQNYANHNDPTVRSAAIESIASWGQPDDHTYIERGLTDNSTQVKIAALSAAYESRLESDAIKRNVFKILSDTNEDLEIRIAAHKALKRYPLSDEEYESAYLFERWMESSRLSNKG